MHKDFYSIPGNINMVLNEEIRLKKRLEEEVKNVKYKSVKLSHKCLFGVTAQMSVMAYSCLNGMRYDGCLLTGVGAFALGTCVPSLIKKVRIADKEYQIYLANKNIEFLNKKKAKIKEYM